ncbi:hypothetical protein AWV79_14780 [Cupriavidus sp. UYMMa02A]|nr:hypothetical protein AWV79_14780 [Cupriavidus sp. UYMMa02A]
MKKLFAALASAALVGTVFAQTGVPASATQSQAEATKAQVNVVKDKSATQEKADKNKKSVGAQEGVAKAQPRAHQAKPDVTAKSNKSAAKGAQHKASKMGAANTEAVKSKADVKSDAAQAKAKADVTKP